MKPEQTITQGEKRRRRKISEYIQKRKKELGYVNSPETRKKISEAMKGKNKGRIPSVPFKKGHIPWSKGLKIGPRSEETKKKMSLAHIGHPSYKSKERNEKISRAQKRRIKEGKHIFWRGGISFIKYGRGWTDTLRESIRQRDKYTCQICGKCQDELVGRMKKLCVHHIDYDKKNLNPNNLITLCSVCHNKTNIQRTKWLKYFYENN